MEELLKRSIDRFRERQPELCSELERQLDGLSDQAKHDMALWGMVQLCNNNFLAFRTLENALALR